MGTTQQDKNKELKVKGTGRSTVVEANYSDLLKAIAEGMASGKIPSIQPGLAGFLKEAVILTTDDSPEAKKAAEEASKKQLKLAKQLATSQDRKGVRFSQELVKSFGVEIETSLESMLKRIFENLWEPPYPYASMLGMQRGLRLAALIPKLAPPVFLAGKVVDELTEKLSSVEVTFQPRMELERRKIIPSIKPDFTLVRDNQLIAGEFALIPGKLEDIPADIRRHILYQLGGYKHYIGAITGINPKMAYYELPEEIEGRRTTELIDEVSAVIQKEGYESENARALLTPLITRMVDDIKQGNFRIVDDGELPTVAQLRADALQIQSLYESMDKTTKEKLVKAIMFMTGGNGLTELGWQKIAEYMSELGIRSDIHTLDGRNAFLEYLYDNYQEIAANLPIDWRFGELARDFLLTRRELEQKLAQVYDTLSGTEDEKFTQFRSMLLKEYAPEFELAEKLQQQYIAFGAKLTDKSRFGQAFTDQSPMSVHLFMKMMPQMAYRLAHREPPEITVAFSDAFAYYGKPPYAEGFRNWVMGQDKTQPPEVLAVTFLNHIGVDPEGMNETHLKWFIDYAKALLNPDEALMIAPDGNVIRTRMYLENAGMGAGAAPGTIIAVNKPKEVKRLKAQYQGLQNWWSPAEFVNGKLVLKPPVESSMFLGRDIPQPITGHVEKVFLTVGEVYGQGVALANPKLNPLFGQRVRIEIEAPSTAIKPEEWRGKYFKRDEVIEWFEGGPKYKTGEFGLYINDVIFSSASVENSVVEGLSDVVSRWTIIATQTYDITETQHVMGITTKSFPTKGMLHPSNPGLWPFYEKTGKPLEAAFIAETKPPMAALMSLFAANPEILYSKYPDLRGKPWSEVIPVIFGFTETDPLKTQKADPQAVEKVVQDFFEPFQKDIIVPMPVEKSMLKLFTQMNYRVVNPITQEFVEQEKLLENAAAVQVNRRTKEIERMVFHVKISGYEFEALGAYGSDYGAEAYRSNFQTILHLAGSNPQLAVNMLRSDPKLNRDSRLIIQAALASSGLMTMENTIRLTPEWVKGAWDTLSAVTGNLSEKNMNKLFFALLMQDPTMSNTPLELIVPGHEDRPLYVPSLNLLASQNFPAKTGKIQTPMIDEFMGVIAQMRGFAKRKYRHSEQYYSYQAKLVEWAEQGHVLFGTFGGRLSGSFGRMAATSTFSLGAQEVVAPDTDEVTVHASRQPETPNALNPTTVMINTPNALTPFAANVTVLNPYVIHIVNGDVDGDTYYIIPAERSVLISQDGTKMAQEIISHGQTRRIRWVNKPKELDSLGPGLWVLRGKGNKAKWVRNDRDVVIREAEIAAVIGRSGHAFEDIHKGLNNPNEYIIDQLKELTQMPAVDIGMTYSERATWQSMVGAFYTPWRRELPGVALQLASRGSINKLLGIISRGYHIAYNKAQGPGPVGSPMRELTTLIRGPGLQARATETGSFVLSRKANMPFLSSSHPGSEQLTLAPKEGLSPEYAVGMFLHYATQVRVGELPDIFEKPLNIPRLVWKSNELMALVAPYGKPEMRKSLARFISDTRRTEASLEEWISLIGEWMRANNYTMNDFLESPFGLGFSRKALTRITSVERAMRNIIRGYYRQAGGDPTTARSQFMQDVEQLEVRDDEVEYDVKREPTIVEKFLPNKRVFAPVLKDIIEWSHSEEEALNALHSWVIGEAQNVFVGASQEIIEKSMSRASLASDFVMATKAKRTKVDKTMDLFREYNAVFQAMYKVGMDTELPEPDEHEIYIRQGDVRTKADEVWYNLTGTRIIRDETGVISGSYSSRLPRDWLSMAMDVEMWREMRSEFSGIITEERVDDYNRAHIVLNLMLEEERFFRLSDYEAFINQLTEEQILALQEFDWEVGELPEEIMEAESLERMVAGMAPIIMDI